MALNLFSPHYAGKDAANAHQQKMGVQRQYIPLDQISAVLLTAHAFLPLKGDFFSFTKLQMLLCLSMLVHTAMSLFLPGRLECTLLCFPPCFRLVYYSVDVCRKLLVIPLL